MKTEEKNTNQLLDFKWDDDTTFFNIENESNDINEKEVDNNNDKEKEEKEVADEKDDIEFFDENEDENITGSLTFDIDKLKKEGIINIDFNPDDIKDEKDVLSLINLEINKRLEEQIDQLIDTIGQEGRAFLNYVKSGGNPKDFIESLKNMTFYPEYKPDDDFNNEKVIEYYYKHIKDVKDDDDIRDTIEIMKEKGTLEKYAKQYSEVLKKKKEEELKEQEKKQKELQENIKKARLEFHNNIVNKLKTNETIKGIRINKKDIEEIPDYLFSPTIKTNDGYITQFNKDMQDIISDPEKVILLAKFMKSGFKLDELVKQIKTEVLKDTRNKINNPGKYNNPKNLADFF